jgi:TRAP-type C4-dicarboxylate transport system substrate-binding protein
MRRLLSIRRAIRIAVVLGVFLSTGRGEKPAKPIRIKLATLAPAGSVWEAILQEMGQRWQKETEGRVTLVIYPGGIIGDESHIVRKIRIGQFHAAMITTVGLSNIDPAVTALSHIPLLYRSYDELDYVREQLRDTLAQRFAERGFIILSWGDAGWVHFFTEKPMTHPNDLRKMKLFFWSNESGDPAIWHRMGFRPVPLAATDIMMGLQTGLINAFDTTPLAALSNQWFAAVNYMTDLPWAPMVGATILSKRTWDLISSDDQERISAAGRDAEEKLKYESRRLNRKAVTVMQEHGLQVSRLSATDRAAWEALVRRVYPYIRREIVPPYFFDAAVRLQAEYQRTQDSYHPTTPDPTPVTGKPLD